MKHLLFAALAAVMLLAAYLALRPRVERVKPSAPTITWRPRAPVLGPPASRDDVV